MTLRVRIATKILALAVSLLGLTLALSLFSTREARTILNQLRQISATYQPLDLAIESLDGDGLKERVAFERWYGALDSLQPDAEILEQASQEYRQYATQLENDFGRIHQLLAKLPTGPQIAQDLGRLRALSGESERDFPLRTELERRILDREKKGDHAGARELMEVHASIAGNIQNRRDELVAIIAGLTEQASKAAEDEEARLMIVTAVATGSAILFGLVFAWLMTQRMVHPVRLLMDGVASVEKGDLSVEVPVASTDEIGALTGSFNRLVVELRSKEKIKETFGKYIDKRIVDTVILNPSAAETEGGRREMTVSFCDLWGFTSISEQMTPTNLVRLLNRHFSLISEAIQAHQGVLDKFIGDAVLAFWGPPFCSSSTHAEQACRAALAQIQALDTFRKEIPELTGLRKNIPVIDLRIGLAAGEVVVGNIGSENSRSYTVMGDTVNVASRLEGINRLYGTQILVNQHTRDLTVGVIEMREIDSIAVKGKEEPARVFEVLGITGEVPESKLTCRLHYEVALAEYRAGNWDRAEAGFREALKAQPGDGPSRLLLSRLDQFRAAPPVAADWDAVLHLTEK